MIASKHTKIVCTLGPTSRDRTTLFRLAQEGMDVARFNFSHGTHPEHAALMKSVALTSKRVGRPIAILQDLQGPKIRVGEIAKEGVKLVEGKRAVFATGDDPIPGDIPVTLSTLHQDVKKGQRILLDDGLLDVVVERVEGRRIFTEVVHGGMLTSHKGMNIPGANLRIPAVSEKDRLDAIFGVKCGVDYVACSFVRTAKDVMDLRDLLDRQGARGKQTAIIVKIEKGEAIENFDEILPLANGIMVARGDLGVETSAARVPLVQKQLIAACRERAVPVIVATQMLHTMTHSPRPTRAEVSDVANAVIDHADALMLSGETANGEYPVEAVKMMAQTIREIESSRYDDVGIVDVDVTQSVPEVVGATVRVIVDALGKVPVIAATASGRTAREVSSFRPEVPILALTTDERVARRLALVWGVDAVAIHGARSQDRLVSQGFKVLKDARKLKKGQMVVVVTGTPVGKPGSANRIEILKVE